MDQTVSTNRLPKIEQPLVSRDMNRWIGLSAVVALLVLIFDLMSKWLVVRELGPKTDRSHIEIAGSFFELRYSVNSGVAFGLFDGNSTLTGILVGLVVIPMIVVLFVMATRGPRWAIASGLVLGGAAGNLLDRVGDGVVTDFISVGRWPTFNLADTAITVGALVLIGLSLLDHDDKNTMDKATS